jgi:hypothetical protein
MVVVKEKSALKCSGYSCGMCVTSSVNALDKPYSSGTVRICCAGDAVLLLEDRGGVDGARGGVTLAGSVAADAGTTEGAGSCALFCAGICAATGPA